MADQPRRRVVLLARPGEARSRLEAALRDAGTDLVLVADPLDAEPAEVGSAQPEVILVSLEPAIEETLERYEPLFADPSITVLFDEADLAAQREGWDAARWARHLSAKLHRHEDVLPPGRESETDWPQPGPLPRRADVGELDITAYAGEALELAAVVPRAGGFEHADGGEPKHVGFGELSLVDDDARTEPDALPSACRGAVLVEGGIGAPDAVRQLLAALPADFAHPVLVRLQLDGGRYDRLVAQIARVSTLPVALAVAGEPLQAGRVYFLEPATALGMTEGGLQFRSADGPQESIHDTLAADDSAIVFLSGSDPARVDDALASAGSGTLVLGQAIDECYEPAAARALAERGGDTAAAADLAARLARRWPTGGNAGGSP